MVLSSVGRSWALFPLWGALLVALCLGGVVHPLLCCLCCPAVVPCFLGSAVCVWGLRLFEQCPGIVFDPSLKARFGCLRFVSCLSCFFLFFVLFSLFLQHFSSPAPGVPFARLDAGALATQPCVVFSTMCVLLSWFLGACARAQGKPGTSQVCPVLTSQLCWSLARTRLRSRVRSSFLSADLCLQRRRPWREVHPKCLRSFSFVVCFSHPPWWVRAGVFLILLLLLAACPCGSFASFFFLMRLILASRLVAFLCCRVFLTCLLCSRFLLWSRVRSSFSIAPDRRGAGTGLEDSPASLCQQFCHAGNPAAGGDSRTPGWALRHCPAPRGVHPRLGCFFLFRPARVFRHRAGGLPTPPCQGSGHRRQSPLRREDARKPRLVSGSILGRTPVGVSVFESLLWRLRAATRGPIFFTHFAPIVVVHAVHPTDFLRPRPPPLALRSPDTVGLPRHMAPSA